MKLIAYLFRSIALAAVVAAPTFAYSESGYPSKPVKLIVPYPAGGSTDVVARKLGQAIADGWKQPVIVDNRGGASGMIGLEAAARSDKDGYTIVMSATGPQAINVGLFPKINYDPVKDFEPILQTAIFPLLMVAPANAPYRNVMEFISWAGVNKGTVNFCSIGTGSPSHLAGELFASMTKLQMTHVPYRGSSPALVDLMGGICNVMFDSALTAGPHVRSGKLKLLAVGTDSRMTAFPSVPTVSESGVPGFTAYTWTALFAPSGTPAPIVEKIRVNAAKAIASPDFRALLEAQGAIPGTGGGPELAAFLKSEIEKSSKLIKERGIKPE
ncbi:tripartite tricarboxylate transporter substrate binding protein [Xenophilus arseniciresistens]|uniref:Tripartite tricarboxylate transporter substrate binding protein n=1 Tax=Xenophilus arseniciresistens TaxID=1283306 RepID=A0AAE3T269_9BURK|nr:tripartite tricarboxylate transporter substrate binding protein [Xenophilus arseniciresistens]MDA7418102.1 tripartite tricarboxylate transporter substrate binding protein [Xenophilus arseniciresistens]